ncbi:MULTISPECIES: ATP-binding protein [unclassified Thioalkalivibrio]|uniref:ATP-binding protein n=1 Tax=unclassified Thioalkalivibrio TaxID=2621013 RepID=UPI00047554E5|nr:MULTISPECIES: ATP-binding protein [unclassified Thioalkalivibrio]
MSTHMADVTIHIDENTDHAARERIQDTLRGLPGVMAASSHDERPHLMVVEYDPERVSSRKLLDTVTASGVHAELIGL